MPIIYLTCLITRVTRGRDLKTVPQKRRQVLTNSPGATIAVKNPIGFLTTGDSERRFGSSEEMRGFFWGYKGIHADYGLLGRQMARIRRADLNIVDAIWVSSASNQGGCPNDCIRQDVLLASTDPFALDYYASVNVLAPLSPSRWLRNIARSVLRRSSRNDANAAYHNGKFRSRQYTLGDRHSACDAHRPECVPASCVESVLTAPGTTSR